MPMQTGIPVLGTFGGSIAASGTTAAALLIQPFPGPAGNAPYIYNPNASYASKTNALVSQAANWLAAPQFGVAHISSLVAQCSSTSHTLLILRPLNWTYFPSGLAKNTTAIPDTGGAAGTGIFDDPGIYSTNYRYPTAGGIAPSQVADAAISSTNKYVCYQLSDGSWQLDTIASGTFGSTLTLTTGTPNRNSGTIPTGGVLFYFGAAAGTLKDPATGLASWSAATTVSVTNTYQDMLAGEYCALRPGDPLLVFDLNGTAADTVAVAGYWGAF